MRTELKQYIVLARTTLHGQRSMLSRLSIEAECAERAEQKAMGYEFVISVVQAAELED